MTRLQVKLAKTAQHNIVSMSFSDVEGGTYVFSLRLRGDAALEKLANILPSLTGLNSEIKRSFDGAYGGVEREVEADGLTMFRLGQYIEHNRTVVTMGKYVQRVAD